MRWFLVTGEQRIPLSPGVRYVVGRDEESDIVVGGFERVSRRHVEIDVAADGESWTVRDLSTNGTAWSGGYLEELTGTDELALVLGGPHGPLCVLTEERRRDLATVARPVWPGRGNLAAPRLGRAIDNDVVIDSLLASPHHARVIKQGDERVIIDLSSARGTFVNGSRVSQATLREGDIVSIGGQSFLIGAAGGFERVALVDGVPLEARGLAVLAGGQTLLNGVSFSVPPRSLVAVVGPSGSGKSTLLNSLTGVRPADRGQVLIDGQDFYRHFDDWRFRVGYVPQQDLVPPQLTVKQALTYAAKLRFPSDTTAAERRARVEQVLADLKLSERRELRIDHLSGGQRKRVSVALELLTRPPVLFLDEPTSGLDPGLDQQLMMLLRELAHDGRTVLVVTHAMENLDLCDRVLVLAAGGYLAYYGPPQKAAAYFGAKDWPGVFLALESRPSHEWARDFEASKVADPTVEIPPEPPKVIMPATPLAPVRRESGIRQWATLAGRTFKVTIADRAYLALLVALPIVLAGLGFLVGTNNGLGLSDSPDGLNPDARILLLVLILGAAFTGAATSIQELVKERVIYQRERAVGLSPGAYITSKAAVLGSIAFLQGVVFAFLTLLGRPAAAEPLVTAWPHLDVMLIVGLLAATSCMLGLALSAVIPTREATLPVLVIVTMVQLVLSGAIPLRWGEIDDVVGVMVPAYWAFKALVAITDLPLLLGPAADEDWQVSTDVVFFSAGILMAMAALFIVASVVLVRRSDPGRRR